MITNNPINQYTNIQMPNGGNFVTRSITWLKSHKKLILVIVAVIFLFIVLGFTIFQSFKDRLFPTKKPSGQISQNLSQNPNTPAVMQIQTSKESFSLSEKVLIKVIATSKGEAVRAFDALIEYDPEFLSLTNKKSPTKPEFQYYGSNTGTLLQVSAVQKPDISADQIFDNSALFEFEFTPKKSGKTTFKIIYAPNATNESNLINKKSKDILGSATGKEVTIQ